MGCKSKIKCGNKISAESITNLFADELREVGIGKNKIKYIRELTSKVTSGQLNFDELNKLGDEQIIAQMKTISGIGSWTAKMYLIFALARLDVSPFEDGAFLQAYRWLYNTEDIAPKSVMDRCKKWKPFSSIAARYLYKALDGGLTKNTMEGEIDEK